jgi:hypothetical protein
MPVQWVRPERLRVLSVQAERPRRPSGPLLIRGFGVRVPGGAPLFYAPDLWFSVTAPPWSHRGHISVEIELVALDVLHQEARLVVLIGGQ